MTQPETLLVARIRAAIKREFPDSTAIKVHGGPYQEAGIPDLFVVINGRLVALEVKRRKAGESEQHARERTTPQQQAMIDRLRASGAVAGTVLDVEEALALCREVYPPR